jgi:hypothetical protein
MAKTDDALSGRSAKVEFDVTAAMTAAIASLTTVAWLDISQIFVGPMDQGQQVTLPIAETNVSGDSDPIGVASFAMPFPMVTQWRGIW